MNAAIELREIKAPKQAGTKPAPLSVVRDNIPQELRDCDQWVVWRFWLKDSKWTKPPHSAFTHKKCSVTDPLNFATFDEAHGAYLEGDFDGIGFVLTESDPFAGIDLDHCLNDGIIDPWALEIINLMASYTEVSPSGTGIRIIVKGVLPAACKRNNVEIYDRARYLTITGHLWGADHAS